MAIQQRLSEVVDMKLVEEHGVSTLEMEFRFILYRLALDDERMVKKMKEMLAEAEHSFPKKKPAESTKMPKFYKDKKEASPL